MIAIAVGAVYESGCKRNFKLGVSLDVIKDLGAPSAVMISPEYRAYRPDGDVLGGADHIIILPVNDIAGRTVEQVPVQLIGLMIDFGYAVLSEMVPAFGEGVEEAPVARTAHEKGGIS